MDAYFYTLDLGPRHGPKLENLAALASYEDVEAFAAMILRHALDQLEEEMRIAAHRDECMKRESATDADFDDEIPF